DSKDGDEPAEADGRARTTATPGSGLLLADRRGTQQQRRGAHSPHGRRAGD
ncbi:MAG: hypothetical protein AVDCRST_MAG93-7555, partial [uncultured Chloroflexia bacterium]